MIERKIIEQRMKELSVQEYISSDLRNSGHSHTRVQRTPMGEKVIIYTSRPGMIVGRKGQNIKKLTIDLKKKYHLENPQIEIAEVDNINLDASLVAERVAMSLERFGSARFKGIAHKVLTDVMAAGAKGIELKISGKVPSMRAKTWRFFNGYLKKCGDIAITGVRRAYATARLKSGVIGIQVRIMPSTTILPDDIRIIKPGESPGNTGTVQQQSVPASGKAADTTADPASSEKETKEADKKAGKRKSRRSKNTEADKADTPS